MDLLDQFSLLVDLENMLSTQALVENYGAYIQPKGQYLYSFSTLPKHFSELTEEITVETRLGINALRTKSLIADGALAQNPEAKLFSTDIVKDTIDKIIVWKGFSKDRILSKGGPYYTNGECNIYLIVIGDSLWDKDLEIRRLKILGSILNEALVQLNNSLIQNPEQYNTLHEQKTRFKIVKQAKKIIQLCNISKTNNSNNYRVLSLLKNWASEITLGFTHHYFDFSESPFSPSAINNFGLCLDVLNSKLALLYKGLQNVDQYEMNVGNFIDERTSFETFRDILTLPDLPSYVKKFPDKHICWLQSNVSCHKFLKLLGPFGLTLAGNQEALKILKVFRGASNRKERIFKFKHSEKSLEKKKKTNTYLNNLINESFS